MNTLVKTNGDGWKEGRAGKREDKDGQSASSRLVWNVCVLVNRTWDRSSVRHLSIVDDERVADRLLGVSLCPSLLHPCEYLEFVTQNVSRYSRYSRYVERMIFIGRPVISRVRIFNAASFVSLFFFYFTVVIRSAMLLAGNDSETGREGGREKKTSSVGDIELALKGRAL